jgi:hypothetical protein
MIPPALRQGRYTFEEQVIIGTKLGGRKHKVDWLVTTRDGTNILVSVKWQQSSGTAEEKVPFEIMCLADAIAKSNGKYRKAYLILGGTQQSTSAQGWTLRGLYLGEGLKQYLKNCESVEVVSLEGFIAKANQGKL